MPTHDHPHDGDERKTDRRSAGYFPLAPGLLHDPRLSDLTWRQRYVFVTLLANAWRGADRNGRFMPGQVIRSPQEIAEALGIRLDHLRADLARMASSKLLEFTEERLIVTGFDHWYGWSGGPDDRPADSQNGEADSQNGNPFPQNGVTDSQIGVVDSQNGVKDSQNGVAEVPSAQRAQGFVPSVRGCSDVLSEDSSYVSSSDVPAAAVAATVTSTAGDDDLTCGSDSNYDGNDNGNDNGRLENGPPGSSSPSGLRGQPERSEGPRRGHPAAPPIPTNDLAGDQQVEDLLKRAGLNPSQAKRYCGTITPREASDMIGTFTRYYLDKGLPEKVVPCLVSSLSLGRGHVQAVISGSRPRPGYCRVEPGAGATGGEPRREETAAGLERSREDNHRKRQGLGELAGRL